MNSPGFVVALNCEMATTLSRFVHLKIVQTFCPLLGLRASRGGHHVGVVWHRTGYCHPARPSFRNGSMNEAFISKLSPERLDPSPHFGGPELSRSSVEFGILPYVAASESERDCRAGSDKLHRHFSCHRLLCYALFAMSCSRCSVLLRVRVCVKWYYGFVDSL